MEITTAITGNLKKDMITFIEGWFGKYKEILGDVSFKQAKDIIEKAEL